MILLQAPSPITVKLHVTDVEVNVKLVSARFTAMNRNRVRHIIQALKSTTRLSTTRLSSKMTPNKFDSMADQETQSERLMDCVYDNAPSNLPVPTSNLQGSVKRGALLCGPLTLEEAQAQQKLDEAIAARRKAKIKQKQATKLSAAQVQLKHARQYISDSLEDSSGAVILISIDIEAWERDTRNTITEVGIATLDLQHLEGKMLGKLGEEMHEHIVARHFIIEENKHRINKDFVRGCPDRFEFGTSEVVSLKDIASVLASCFRHPFSKAVSKADDADERSIVLVGHGIDGDIEWCKRLGFSILNRSSIVEVLDTATMFRGWSGEKQDTSLGRMVSTFDLVTFNPHNAGNDAVHTLWAFLAMCVAESPK